MYVRWLIEDVERRIADGFVLAAQWKAFVEDEGRAVNLSGRATWGGDGPLLIPFPMLTEEAVLKWVWQQVDKEAAEKQLADKIEELRKPKTAFGLPWIQN